MNRRRNAFPPIAASATIIATRLATSSPAEIHCTVTTLRFPAMIVTTLLLRATQ